MQERYPGLGITAQEQKVEWIGKTDREQYSNIQADMKKKGKFNIKEIRQWINLNRDITTFDLMIQIILMHVDEKFTKSDLVWVTAIVSAPYSERRLKRDYVVTNWLTRVAFNNLVSQQIIEYTPRQPLVINKNKMMKFMMEK